MNVKALTLSLGIVWGVAIFLTGIIAMFGWGTYMVDVFSSLYIGYKASFFGAIIGMIWAFVDGALFGFFISYLYNFFAKKENVK